MANTEALERFVAGNHSMRVLSLKNRFGRRNQQQQDDSSSSSEGTSKRQSGEVGKTVPMLLEKADSQR